MAKAKAIMELPCKFGNVGFGVDVASTSISIERARIAGDLKTVEETFGGNRIVGNIVSRSAGGSEQASLPGADHDIRINVAFDVKKYHVSRKVVGFTMALSLSGLNKEDLASISQTSGMLNICVITKLNDDAGEGDEE
jgi:hypothetical protein